jgi:hypothetical protein
MTRLFVLLFAISACAAQVRYVPGTRVPYSNNNDAVLKAVEDYRLAVERADVDALMLMAHKQYWETSGTPTGADDYGYDGLRNVLLTRFQKASEIRYSMRYVSVHQQCPGELQSGCRAQVEVLVDASFSIIDAFGKPIRMDKRDQNQLVLEWDDNSHRWLFLSGY